MIVHFYSEGGVETPSLFLNFFRSGSSGTDPFSSDSLVLFDPSKTDVFDPLFMDKIVSIIAIKKNRAVRIQVSLDHGFADLVPVPKP